MLSRGNRIIGPAATVALVCFFLPWILVSCAGQPVVSFSGWELAAGTEVQTGLGTQPVEGHPVLFLVLLAALGCLALVYFVYQHQIAVRTSAYAAIGLAGVSLLALFATFSAARSQTAKIGIAAHLQYGFWGTVLADIAVIIGAVLDLKGAESQLVLDKAMEFARAWGPGSKPPPAKGIVCPNCGALNDPGAKFCQNCGAKLQPEPVICPKCGAVNEPGAKFCSQCGARLYPEDS